MRAPFAFAPGALRTIAEEVVPDLFLTLYLEPVPMMCVEERFRRALAGGRAPQQ